MHCTSCKSENLLATIKADIMLPLAQKGGNVITAGYTVTQKTVEGWWRRTLSGEERSILGPIHCVECGLEHTYFKGLPPALRAVPYEEAMKHGYDHYAASNAKAPPNEE